jgi:hypothetical protein
MAVAAAGRTGGVIMGAVICLGLLLLTIAAVIILSLISIYRPNISQQGYGEGSFIYTIFFQIKSHF